MHSWQLHCLIEQTHYLISLSSHLQKPLFPGCQFYISPTHTSTFKHYSYLEVDHAQLDQQHAKDLIQSYATSYHQQTVPSLTLLVNANQIPQSERTNQPTK